MSKHSKEFKLKVIKDYYEGGRGPKYLAEKYGISAYSLIQSWINTYEQDGEEGLTRKNTKKKYSGEFKLHCGFNRKKTT